VSARSKKRSKGLSKSGRPTYSLRFPPLHDSPSVSDLDCYERGPFPEVQPGLVKEHETPSLTGPQARRIVIDRRQRNRDAEFLEDPLRQIDQPPADHAVHCRNRATLDDADDGLALDVVALSPLRHQLGPAGISQARLARPQRRRHPSHQPQREATGGLLPGLPRLVRFRQVVEHVLASVVKRTQCRTILNLDRAGSGADHPSRA
jgi:hypothetical protein